jgi:hypothetical protein
VCTVDNTNPVPPQLKAHDINGRFIFGLTAVCKISRGTFFLWGLHFAGEKKNKKQVLHLRNLCVYFLLFQIIPFQKCSNFMQLPRKCREKHKFGRVDVKAITFAKRKFS